MLDVDNHPYAFFKQHYSDEDAYHEWVVSQFNNEGEIGMLNYHNYHNYYEAMRALVKEQIKEKNKYEIVDVIFNGPATIVFWRDGTKTVVKRAIGDPFSEDAGVALCIAKKMMGDGFHRALRDAVKKGRMNRRRLIRNEK